ncbi:acyltransferase family-domain-containing protein [Halenospora varia]|nr:acyltransferase family-domain-containing protein [Halenospora varia]
MEELASLTYDNDTDRRSFQGPMNYHVLARHSEDSSSSDHEYKEFLHPRAWGFSTWRRIHRLWHLPTSIIPRFRLSEFIQPHKDDRIWLYICTYAAVISPYVLAALPRYMHKGGLQPAKKLHPTSYLDALRGVAALIVLNHHHFPYENLWIVQQPLFRLLISGRGMVDVFFVISGYVLSYRMLKLMRTRQAGPLLDSLASACFRRYIRLYLSATAASFASMMLLRIGWAAPCPRKDTFLQQLGDWALDQARFSNPFVDLQGYWTPGMHSSKYLDVLWTIPVEFRGSLVLFFFCAASCKLSTRSRMLFCWFLISLCYYWAVVYPALFLGGFFLADLSFTRHPERLSPPLPTTILLSASTADNTPPGRTTKLSTKIFYITTIIFALFILGQPSNGLSECPWPWPILEKFIPPSFRGSGVWEHFWLSVGALLLVFALDSYPILQTPLNWNFCQYLGYCSFGIYVMHILVVWSFWRLILDPLRNQWLGGAMWTFAPCLLINYAAVLWAADIFSRVDAKVVRLGRWIEKRVFEW